MADYFSTRNHFQRESERLFQYYHFWKYRGMFQGRENAHFQANWLKIESLATEGEALDSINSTWDFVWHVNRFLTASSIFVMSQKFRTITNAVSAGRKLNDLAAKNQRNVTFFMEPDGVAHIFTLTDAERVSYQCYLKFIFAVICFLRIWFWHV